MSHPSLSCFFLYANTSSRRNHQYLPALVPFSFPLRANSIASSGLQSRMYATALDLKRGFFRFDATGVSFFLLEQCLSISLVDPGTRRENGIAVSAYLRAMLLIPPMVHCKPSRWANLTLVCYLYHKGCAALNPLEAMRPGRGKLAGILASKDKSITKVA